MGKKQNSINNIFSNRPTVKEYLTVENSIKEKIDEVIKAVKPNMILRSGKFQLKPKQEDFWDLSWGELILLRKYIEEKNISTVMYLIFNVSQEKFFELDVYNCFAVYKWINEQNKEIIDLEIEELGGAVSIEEKEAGVEELNRFGYTVSLDVLANGNILKYDEILKKPYHEIFKKLCLNKTKNDIQKNYIENARRKNKANSY